MADINYNSDLTFDEKVMMAIVRAADYFKRAQTAIFKQYGLSFPQYNILRVLDSSENGQNKISVVSKIMIVPGANMTGLAKRLELKGFIDRKPDPDDERVTLLAITPKGREAIKLLEDAKNDSISDIFSDLSQAEKELFLTKFKRIITLATEQYSGKPARHLSVSNSNLSTKG